MQRYLRSFTYLAATALLAACGGGGGAPPVSTPPPPIASPPPTYSSFAAPTGDQQVPLMGVAMEHEYVTGPAAPSDGDGIYELTPAPHGNVRLSVTYNASTNSYTARDGAESGEFFAADQYSVEWNGPAFVHYITGQGTRHRQNLSVYRPTGGGGDVALTYTTLVEWGQHKSTDGPGLTESRTNSFWGVGGFETIVSDMPRTGSATYVGPLRGYGHGPVPPLSNPFFPLRGESRLTANFSLGTVLAELTVNRLNVSTVILTGSGQISANRFGGQLSGGGYTGSFEGAFYGPGASEMGLRFMVSAEDGRLMAGVGAGRR